MFQLNNDFGATLLLCASNMKILSANISEFKTTFFYCALKICLESPLV